MQTVQMYIANLVFVDGVRACICVVVRAFVRLCHPRHTSLYVHIAHLYTWNDFRSTLSRLAICLSLRICINVRVSVLYSFNYMHAYKFIHFFFFSRHSLSVIQWIFSNEPRNHRSFRFLIEICSNSTFLYLECMHGIRVSMLPACMNSNTREK